MARALCIVTLVFLAAPAAASADSCMCVTAQATWDDAPLGHAPVLQSVELGPFFSSDGSALSSRLEESSAQRRRGGPPTDVLWCASPDDPRCSGGETPPERGPHTGDASHGAAPEDDARVRVGPDRDGRLVTPRHGDGPRAGVRGRVDRPPRS